MIEAAEEILMMEDLRNFGLDYDKTLMVWPIRNICDQIMIILNDNYIYGQQEWINKNGSTVFPAISPG